MPPPPLRRSERGWAKPQPRPLPYGGPRQEFSLSSRRGRRGTGRAGASVLDGLSPSLQRSDCGWSFGHSRAPALFAVAARSAPGLQISHSEKFDNSLGQKGLALMSQLTLYNASTPSPTV